jgi:acetoin utilization deacetylase AcuC-like enzyme
MHDLFGRHDPGPGHPERQARYGAVEAAVARAGGLRLQAPAADRAAIERVHAPAYLDVLEQVSELGGGALDPDTVLSAASWQAAVHAAGGAIAAADRVLDDPSTAAFSFGRPPGHHACPARAMGFCLVNSAAVAAAHARIERGVERVAVLDWDAHHGNGTQDIFYGDGSVLYVSLHQAPFYPGTGAAGECGEGAGEGATVNVPLAAGTSQDRYLEAFRELALPALSGFAPGLVIVSAGFDAHRRDPLCSLGLDEHGFAAMVTELRELAGGPALVLEGGYDLIALEESVVAVLEAVSR